jgi:hypothetical protein
MANGDDVRALDPELVYVHRANARDWSLDPDRYEQPGAEGFGAGRASTASTLSRSRREPVHALDVL